MSQRFPNEYRPEDSTNQTFSWKRPGDDGEFCYFDGPDTRFEEAEELVTFVTPVCETEHSVALPDGYVPGYAYPLVLWLHQAGEDENEIDFILPQISERNYLGAGVRGNVTLSCGYDWSTTGDGLADIQQRLAEVLEGMQGTYNVHPDRIFLAGFGQAGSVALELLLSRPDLYKGAAAICSSYPKLAHPLMKFRLLHGRQVLLAAANDSPQGLVAETVAQGRILYTAGMQVASRVYQSSAGLTEKMLRDLDHWIMSGISTAIRA